MNLVCFAGGQVAVRVAILICQQLPSPLPLLHGLHLKEASMKPLHTLNPEICLILIKNHN